MTKKLSPSQLKAVALLAEGHSGKYVAGALSVTQQTICEWKKSPNFEAAVNSIAIERLDATRIRLHHATESAIESLLELTRETSPPETRRKASVDILRLAGFEPGDSSSYAWGIGGTSVDQVEKDRKITENPELAALLGDLYY